MQRDQYPNRTELTGYKLHRERLAYTGKDSIRTIKFPLGELSDIPNYEKSKKKRIILNSEAEEFVKKIKHDYEALYGPLNLITYIERPNVYSLKDFWVDSLRAGIIMVPSTTKLKEVISVYCGLEEELDRKQEKKMKDTNPKFFECIDYEKFKKEVISQGAFRKAKTSLSFFKNDCDEKYKETTKKEILKATVGKEAKIKEEYFKKNYGVDKTIFERNTPDSNEKPSFYVFPDLPLMEDLPIEDCIERIQKQIVDKINKKSKKNEKINYFLGVSDNANGFSSYFNIMFNKLKKGDVSSIIKTIICLQSSVWKGKENELKKRLNFLSDKAKLLEKPKIVNEWHYYRTDMAGKIESWLSNSFGQDYEIKKQLFGSYGEKWSEGRQVNDIEKKGHYQELDEVEKKLNNFKSYEEISEEIDELKKEISEMKNLLDKIKQDSKIKNIPIKEEDDSERISFEYLENYGNLISGFRTNLNYVWQHEYGYIEDEEETKKQKEKPKKANKTFSALHKNLKSVPQFLGENKIKEGGIYDKYLQSLDRLNEGFDFLIEFQNAENKFAKSEELSKDKQIERIKQALQSLLRTYRMTDSIVTRDIITKALKRFYDGDIKKLRDKKRKYDYFFRKKQAREERGEKLELSIKDDKLLNSLSKLLNDLKVKWDKYRKIDHWNNGKTYSEWVGLIELEKVRLGLVAAFYNISSINKKLEKMNKHFPNVELVFSRYQEDEKFESKNISKVIQQAVLSELKGTVSKMSTKEFVMRYVVQPINSEVRYPIAINEKKYHIQLPEKVDKKSGGDGEIKILSGKVLNKNGLKEKPYKESNLLKINSSKYQLQFFDNAFSGKWKEFSPKISSYSFIYEETYKVNWTAKKPKFELDNERKRLYVSIPFNLEYKNKKYKEERLASRKNFLGVDIGEYGIAMYMLDTTNFSCASASFIYEPTLRKIAESVKKLGDEKRAGTFSVPNTKLKRQRDYAITSLRNKIHNLVVTSDARPLYEKEVSGFESGSGKISKIYHSIKRSDVYAEIAADELEHKLVWGDKKLMMGNDVGAYATSYMCSHCCKSIYALIEKKDYKQKYRIKAVNGRVFLVDIDGENVYGYFKERKSVGEEINGEDALKAIKKYARPPLDLAVERISELGNLFKVKKYGLENNPLMASFKKERGSQAIYICPFKNCHQISDADKQAAMWIALKGYLNMFTIRKKEAKGIRKLETKVFKNEEIADNWSNSDLKGKLEYLLNFARDKKIPPVEFILDSRYFEKNKRKNAA